MNTKNPNRKKKGLRNKMPMLLPALKPFLPIAIGAGSGLIDFIGKGDKKKIGDDLKAGLEKLLNRSQFKGVMDGAERSHAVSGDLLRKLGALSGATGKNFLSIVKEVGAKA